MPPPPVSLALSSFKERAAPCTRTAVALDLTDDVALLTRPLPPFFVTQLCLSPEPAGWGGGLGGVKSYCTAPAEGAGQGAGKVHLTSARAFVNETPDLKICAGNGCK